VKDNKGDSRADCGRAVIFKETNFHPFTYTIEANYCTGHSINYLNKRFDLENGKKLIKEESAICDAASKSLYPSNRVPIYTP